jgi:hypothetical protein
MPRSCRPCPIRGMAAAWPESSSPFAPRRDRPGERRLQRASLPVYLRSLRPLPPPSQASGPGRTCSVNSVRLRRARVLRSGEASRRAGPPQLSTRRMENVLRPAGLHRRRRYSKPMKGPASAAAPRRSFGTHRFVVASRPGSPVARRRPITRPRAHSSGSSMPSSLAPEIRHPARKNSSAQSPGRLARSPVPRASRNQAAKLAQRPLVVHPETRYRDVQATPSCIARFRGHPAPQLVPA